MVYIVLASILLLVVLAGLGYGVATREIGGWVAAGAAVLSLVLLTVLMGLTTVSARAVGIQTAFGKYQNTLTNGLQFTAPWSEVEEFSTQVQYLDLDGKDQGVKVTFKGGGGGTVDAVPRWRIDPEGAENLWKKYKTFENVRDQLVNSSAKDSFRVVLSQYTPNEARDGDNLRPIAEQVQKDLSESLKDDGILIDSVSVKGISLDKRSQDSLDKVVTANNDIERAKAEQERARIDAETAKIREQGGSLSDKALVRYCLEVVNSWDSSKNGPLPAGFSCMGNGNPFVVTNK